MADDETENKSEDQYRKCGAAYHSIVLQICALTVGETVDKMTKAQNPDVAKQTELRDLIYRNAAAARRTDTQQQQQPQAADGTAV